MLTAAVRDLQRTYPGRYQIDVRTAYPELWMNNPWLSPISDSDSETCRLRCEYPLIHKANRLPVHFLHGFVQDLSLKLGIPLFPTAFKGDVHLTEHERSTWPTGLTGLCSGSPFWIVNAGGKYDFTIKWWSWSRFQHVVNRLAGKVTFVQVGAAGDYHPPLKNVIDLCGRTSIRELIHLVHHASGVLCPVTLVMHLAAAVDVPKGRRGMRPCVVIAGGREPPSWEAYPAHQFLHNVGALHCSSEGGCWQSRTVPLGDGDPRDSVYSRCHYVVNGLPKCMDMISVDAVVEAIEMYFVGGQCKESSIF